ncbi:MAG: hypothetical protein AB7F23_08705 [Phycisphaerae bacterium]
MRNLTILAVVAMLSTVSIAAAAENLDVSVSASYMSKYLWHGYDLYDNEGAFKTTVSISSKELSAYADVSYISPMGSGRAYTNAEEYNNILTAGETGYPIGQSDEWDFTVGVLQTLLEGDIGQADIDFSYSYYHFGDVKRWETLNTIGGPMRQKTLDWSGEDRDLQEIAVDIEMPNLIDGRIIPHYRLAYIFEAGGYGGSAYSQGDNELPLGQDVAYFEHALGLRTTLNDYGTPVYASVDVFYNDGKQDIQESGFSRVLAGLAAEFDLGVGKLVPAIYYQGAIANDVYNLEDELFATVTYKIDF